MKDQTSQPTEHPRVPRDGESFLDSESAALLRAALQPTFEQASTWAELVSQLKTKGYELAFRSGRLILIESESGGRVCTTRFLGRPLKDLVDRLGRPAVRAKAGRLGAGDLVG